jgi:hypothetical protein
MKIPPFTLRYKILDFLYRIYPEGAEEQTIIEIFYEYHKFEDIKKQLHYLLDCGYIEKKETPIMLGSRRLVSWYKMNPKGIDLINGVIQDKAVPIPEEE